MSTVITAIVPSEITHLRLTCPTCGNIYEFKVGSKFPGGCSVSCHPYDDDQKKTLRLVQDFSEALSKLVNGKIKVEFAVIEETPVQASR